MLGLREDIEDEVNRCIELFGDDNLKFGREADDHLSVLIYRFAKSSSVGSGAQICATENIYMMIRSSLVEMSLI